MAKSKQQKLKEKLDRVFSQYIRKSNANHQGYATCVTCGVSKPWEEQQAGHYIPRNILATRFEENNVHVQCVSCNVFNKGRMAEYAIYLRKRYQDTILEDLDRQRAKITKWGVKEYEEKIKYYEDKLKAL